MSNYDISSNPALVSEGIVKSLDEIKGVGHRIVQGGKYFDDSAIFDEAGDTESKIESLVPLAPLHNGAHLVGYRAFKRFYLTLVTLQSLIQLSTCR